MKLKSLLKKVSLFCNSKYYGFIQGHGYLTLEDKVSLKKLIGVNDEKLISSFENEFSKLIGSGSCVSFASGRMGFYSVMKSLGITSGDEVILNGSTCAVMVNAVLKTGAKVVYSDIDPNTFGSCAKSIEKCITKNTKIIVAQHSFGIPCKIDEIQKICSSKGLFLLEDSALALGSSYKGKLVGSFGNAALFSTDHSKPLNTFTGGMIYSEDEKLINSLKEIQKNSGELPLVKQNSIWKRLLCEARFANSKNLGKLQLIDTLDAIKRKILKTASPYLDEDFSTDTTELSYPYPAKLPGFLAKLGLIELKRWEKTKACRKENLEFYLDSFKALESQLPKAYFDKNYSIVPLRFVWSSHEGESFRNKLESNLLTSWTWFLEPVIATSTPLEDFYYRPGDCPNAEKLGPSMVNLPTSSPKEDLKGLVAIVSQKI